MLDCEYILFDLDGTLVDSSRSVDLAWSEWAHSQSLLADDVICFSRGLKAIDTMLHFVSEDKISSKMLDDFFSRELELAKFTIASPGSAKILSAIPEWKWAVVTSAPRLVAEARLVAAELPISQVMVTAESTTFCKPRPDPYILAAQMLNADVIDCLVFEDSESGIIAGLAAGMKVIGVGVSQSTAGVAKWIDNFHALQIETIRNKIRINF